MIIGDGVFFFARLNGIHEDFAGPGVNHRDIAIPVDERQPLGVGSAIGGQPHHFALAAVPPEAELFSNIFVHQPPTTPVRDRFEDFDFRALSDAQDARLVAPAAIQRENVGLGETRGVKCAGSVGLVVVDEDHPAAVITLEGQFFLVVNPIP